MNASQVFVSWLFIFGVCGFMMIIFSLVKGRDDDDTKPPTL